MKVALQNGYKIRNVYEIWHWSDDKWGTDLFRDFLHIFIREKTHASGWPSHVQSDEEKQKFAENLFNNEGIKIDEGQMTFNAAKRCIAKLAINSSWGKYGQKSNKSQTYIVDPNSKLFDEIINDETQDVTVDYLSELDIYILNVKKKEDFVISAKNTNVAIAAITTAMGRLILWNALNQAGDRALYCDTDSIIMLTEPGKNNLDHLKGDFLGKWTSEVPFGFRIARFCSTAPKSYAYQLENCETGEIREVIKVKGLVRDHQASQQITFDTMLEMVYAFSKGDQTTISTSRSYIIKQLGCLETRFMTKKLQPVMDKLLVVDNFQSLPYGWSE